jgi:5'-deoxynucleotidase YfbR-like HD superfamily hydrolase
VNRNRILGLVQDAIASKRVLKWGYARTFGGLYPSECDTVAAHAGAVTVLAAALATEVGSVLAAKFGVPPSLEDTLLMAAFHDFGEGRSGDTGAASHAIRGYCNLHALEREALDASLTGLGLHERALRLFDDYRAYRTVEALLVHVADTIEGFEKALHVARGMHTVLQNAQRIVIENLSIFHRRGEYDPVLGQVADYLANEVLVPCLQQLCEAYGVQLKFEVDSLSQPQDAIPVVTDSR